MTAEMSEYVSSYEKNPFFILRLPKWMIDIKVTP
jgi:hypothetical protein